jgi:hypothetical protein
MCDRERASEPSAAYCDNGLCLRAAARLLTQACEAVSNGQRRVEAKGSERVQLTPAGRPRQRKLYAA